MTTNSPPPDGKPPVVFVPGSITPGNLAYGPLLSVIGDEIQPIVKELEVYATDVPPRDYNADMEAEGIRRVADAADAQRFHLVGYSGGGAFALAFAAKYPGRLKSLALIEPAWIGGVPAEDAQDWAELTTLMALPPDQQMQAFRVWHMRPGVPSPPAPPGPPPPWMAKRPNGVRAIFRAFTAGRIDQDRFRLFDGPVYYALGSLTTRFFEREAKTLQGLFPDLQLEEYAGRSHFDPPHRAVPERFAQALRAVWARADAAAVGY